MNELQIFSNEQLDEEDKLNSKTLSSFELNFKDDGIFPVMEGAA